MRLTECSYNRVMHKNLRPVNLSMYPSWTPICGWGHFWAWEHYKISMSSSPHWSTSTWKRTLDQWKADKRPSMLWLATNAIRQLGAYGRTLIGYENYHNGLWLAMKTIRRLGLHERESKKVMDGHTYTDDSISGYTSSRQVATKMDATVTTFAILTLLIL